MKPLSLCRGSGHLIPRRGWALKVPQHAVVLVLGPGLQLPSDVLGHTHTHTMYKLKAPLSDPSPRSTGPVYSLLLVSDTCSTLVIGHFCSLIQAPLIWDAMFVLFIHVYAGSVRVHSAAPVKTKEKRTYGVIRGCATAGFFF